MKFTDQINYTLSSFLRKEHENELTSKQQGPESSTTVTITYNICISQVQHSPSVIIIFGLLNVI